MAVKIKSFLPRDFAEADLATALLLAFFEKKNAVAEQCNVSIVLVEFKLVQEICIANQSSLLSAKLEKFTMRPQN